MQTILLLHGALGAPDELRPLAAVLSERYDVRCPAFPGHAGHAATGYRMPALVGFLNDFINGLGINRPLVFGYSMGGYAALALAAQNPGLLAGVATLATKLHWTPEGATREQRMLDPEKLEAKVPAFAETLARRHAPLNWKEVVQGTAALMENLGTKPLLTEATLSAISDPVLLLLGDRDKMVGFEETLKAYEQIPNASFGMLPGTPHPLEKVPVELLSTHLLYFFNTCRS